MSSINLLSQWLTMPRTRRLEQRRKILGATLQPWKQFAFVCRERGVLGEPDYFFFFLFYACTAPPRRGATHPAKETPKHISFIVPTWLEITTASSSSGLPGKHSNHPNSSSSLGYQADYRTWRRNIFMSCHCPAAQESGIAVCGLFWVLYFTKEKQPLASSERYSTEPTTPNSQYVDFWGSVLIQRVAARRLL